MLSGSFACRSRKEEVGEVRRGFWLPEKAAQGPKKGSADEMVNAYHDATHERRICGIVHWTQALRRPPQKARCQCNNADGKARHRRHGTDGRSRRPGINHHRRLQNSPEVCSPGWLCAVAAVWLNAASSHCHPARWFGLALSRCNAGCLRLSIAGLVTGLAPAAVSTVLLPELSASSAEVTSQASLAATVDAEVG